MDATPGGVRESEQTMKKIRPMIGAALGVAVLALSACAGGANGPGVASLNTPGAQPGVSPTSAASAEEQALAFAQCMRDNGVDFPDPTVNADGSPSFEGAFGRGQAGGFDPTDTTFRDAMNACGSLMQGMVMGSGPGGPGGNFDPAAIQEAMLPYTNCLREQGLDVGDLTLQQPDRAVGAAPNVSPSAGGTVVTGPPPGEQGGGFDRSDMFARMLGQDPTDPAWIAANEACQSLLDNAFGGRGQGVVVGGEG